MKDEKREIALSEIGKFLIDISKLVFGGVILAGIMRYESVNPTLLFGIGGIVFLICCVSGIIFITLSKN